MKYLESSVQKEREERRKAAMIITENQGGVPVGDEDHFYYSSRILGKGINMPEEETKSRLVC